MNTQTEYTEERVWDLPTRLFHWSLVASVSTGWALGEFRTFSTVNYHFYLGYTTAGLIAFRLVWGFIGPPPARLSALFPNPTEVMRYLADLKNREPSALAGHSPLGSLAVLAILASLMVQVSTGLFAEDDSLFSEGPLSYLVSEKTVQFCNAIHDLNSKVLLGLVVLHVAALVFYLIWKRENLIHPMITGRKMVRRD